MLKKIFPSVTLLAVVLAAIFIPFSVNAAGKGEDKLSKALEKYEKTGKIENCLHLRRIYRSRVIDDNNILFIMKGSKAYLNILPHRCSRLGFEKSFSYKLILNNLCNVDIITVFSSNSRIHGPSCMLGKFIEYKKKSKMVKAENN